MPTRPIVLQPQKTTFVWMARSRPNESQGTANRSGQLSFSEARSPPAVPTRSQTVAEATYAYARRTAAGSAAGEGPTGASKPRFCTMARSWLQKHVDVKPVAAGRRAGRMAVLGDRFVGG